MSQLFGLVAALRFAASLSPIKFVKATLDADGSCQNILRQLQISKQNPRM